MLKRYIPLVLALLAATLLAVGCTDDGDDTTTTADSDTTMDDDAMMEDDKMAADAAYMFIIGAVGSGDEIGSATITSSGDGVMVKLEVPESGVSHAAHIHTGTCDEYADVVFPLENVEDGMSETEVAVTMEDIYAEPHIIAVHEDGGDPGEVIGCAELNEDDALSMHEDDAMVDDDSMDGEDAMMEDDDAMMEDEGTTDGTEG